MQDVYVVHEDDLFAHVPFGRLLKRVSRVELGTGDWLIWSDLQRLHYTTAEVKEVWYVE